MFTIEQFGDTARVSLQLLPRLEDAMAIRVLLADDSEIICAAIVRILKEDPRVEVVGVAANFTHTVQMIADFKPEILLMDLHLPEKRDLTPDLVKSQLASIQTIAISISNDEEAKELAASYGALALLDKMNLYSEVAPAILKYARGPFQSAFDVRLPLPRSSENSTTAN